MRVISKKTLKEFYENNIYQDSKNSIESWHKEVLQANWNNSNEIKQQYCNASIVGNNKIIFNIHGNKYRLIVKINFDAKIVFVKFIGTHKQYNNINVKDI